VYDQIGKDGGGWFDAREKFSLMNGKRIGVPLNVEPWIFHMRRDLCEAAGSYWFPALKSYANIDFFTKDEWNKQIAQDVIPYALSPYADGGRNPVYDDIGVNNWGDAMQMVGADGKSPEEAIKFLQQKALEAEEKFKK
jgi:hypothetical protein